MSQLIRPVLRKLAEALHFSKDDYYIDGEGILSLYPNDEYTVALQFHRDVVQDSGAYKYKTIDYSVVNNDTKQIEDSGSFNMDILDRSFLGIKPQDEHTINWYHRYSSDTRSCDDINDVTIEDVMPNTLSELDSIVYHFKNRK